MTTITRRAALGGLASLSAGAPMNRAAVAAPGEDPAERIRMLADDMAEALADYCNGKFRIVVYPSSHPRFPGHVQLTHAERPLDAAWRATASAEDRCRNHLFYAGMAAEELPGVVPGNYACLFMVRPGAQSIHVVSNGATRWRWEA